jgi:hypothetical protein
MLLLSLLGILACAGGRSALRGGLEPETVATFPSEIAAAYDVFALKCSRCHTLSRPLSASIEDYDHWVHYVARMRKMPGSGISPGDGDTILVFLKYYTEHRGQIALPKTETSTGGAR